MQYITRNIVSYVVHVYKLQKREDGLFAQAYVGDLHFRDNPTDAKIKRKARVEFNLEADDFIKYVKEQETEKRRMELEKFMELSEKVED